MLSLRLRCPNPRCGVVLSVPEQLHGQNVRCAGCGENFFVPPLMPARVPSPDENKARGQSSNRREAKPRKRFVA